MRAWRSESRWEVSLVRCEARLPGLGRRDPASRCPALALPSLAASRPAPTPGTPPGLVHTHRARRPGADASLLGASSAPPLGALTSRACALRVPSTAPRTLALRLGGFLRDRVGPGGGHQKTTAVRLLEKSKCPQRTRRKARTKAKKKTSKRGGGAEPAFSSGLFESRAAAFEDSSCAVQLGPSILTELHYETDVNWCTPFWLWSELLKWFLGPLKNPFGSKGERKRI